jgi:peptidoglycan hydrolase CwlO-like protein
MNETTYLLNSLKSNYQFIDKLNEENRKLQLIKEDFENKLEEWTGKLNKSLEAIDTLENMKNQLKTESNFLKSNITFLLASVAFSSLIFANMKTFTLGFYMASILFFTSMFVYNVGKETNWSIQLFKTYLNTMIGNTQLLKKINKSIDDLFEDVGFTRDAIQKIKNTQNQTSEMLKEESVLRMKVEKEMLETKDELFKSKECISRFSLA